jgi:multimeric flavodoxin WrbA
MQEADGIVLGSPMYILSVTGQLKQLLDRLTDVIHCQMLSGDDRGQFRSGGASISESYIEPVRSYSGQR